MSEVMMSLKNLQKSFDQGFCLGPITLDLKKGQTIAFLGKNGAGKSTLFQLMTGNLDATEGEIYFFSEKLSPEKFELKRKLGYLPQHLSLPRWVTGLEMLRYGASLYQLPDAEETIKDLMEYWDCATYSQKPMTTLSHGMQKRVGLALAHMHSPSLLILDEPFSGLDLFHTKALENKILQRREQNLTTVISTHITPYVAKLCDEVFVIDQGKVSWLNPWQDLSAAERVASIEACFFIEPFQS